MGRERDGWGVVGGDSNETGKVMVVRLVKRNTFTCSQRRRDWCHLQTKLHIRREEERRVEKEESIEGLEGREVEMLGRGEGLRGENKG